MQPNSSLLCGIFFRISCSMPEWAKINLQYPLWPRLRSAQAQRCSPHPQLRALSSSHPNSSSERQDAGASLCKWFLWVATRNSHCRPAERYARSPTQEASQGKHSSCDCGDKAHQPRQQMRESWGNASRLSFPRDSPRAPAKPRDFSPPHQPLHLQNSTLTTTRLSGREH